MARLSARGDVTPWNYSTGYKILQPEKDEQHGFPKSIIVILREQRRRLRRRSADHLEGGSRHPNAVPLIELSKKALLLQRAERVISRLSQR